MDAISVPYPSAFRYALLTVYTDLSCVQFSVSVNSCSDCDLAVA